MTAAYIPPAVLAIPTSIISLGGGYLYGQPLGVATDSVGANIGATAAFVTGRTFGRPCVISKLKNYPEFQAAAVVVQKSGFKIVFLLRLVPLIPFAILNYFLRDSHSIGQYMLASWLGITPSTLAFVHVGTTLKDLSDVMHGWNGISTTRRVLVALGSVISVILIVYITKVAKASLDKALIENSERHVFVTTMLPIVASSSMEVH